MAKQNTAAPAVPGVPAQTSPLNVLNAQNAVPQPVSSSVDQASQPANGHAAVNPYAGNPFAALGNLAPNQGKGRERGPVPAISREVGRPEEGTWRRSAGGALPRERVDRDVNVIVLSCPRVGERKKPTNKNPTPKIYPNQPSNFFLESCIDT